MLNKILSIIFIVLFGVALSVGVKLGVEAAESKKWILALTAIAIATFSIVRIVYYAKCLARRDNNEE